MEVALVYLGFKARTEQEVRQKLKGRSFGAIDIDETLRKLKEWKYVDDAEFAKNFVRSRSLARPQSQRSLAFELKKKGLKTSVVVDDLEMARAALARKKNKTPEQQARFLASRGFSWSTIEKIVKKEYNRGY